MNLAELFTSLPGAKFFGGVYVIARALVIAADVMLIFGFLYAFKKAIRFRPRFDVGKSPRKQIQTLRSSYFKERWNKLLKKYAEAPTPDSMRLAVIEADAMVDDVLKDLNFPGDHLADRLSYLDAKEIKTLNNLWDAHRLRNDIVHSPSRRLTVREGMSAIEKYKAFFNELKIFG